MHEEPILQVRNLRKQFGTGCKQCSDIDNRNLEKNFCKHAELFMLAKIFHLICILEKF